MFCAFEVSNDVFCCIYYSGGGFGGVASDDVGSCCDVRASAAGEVDELPYNLLQPF